MSRFGDRLLDDVMAQIDRLVDLPALELPGQLQPIVRRTLLATDEDDGSWADADVLREALRAYLDMLDARMADDGITGDDLGADDRRWLDACWACVRAPQLFDDMLEDLRASIPPPGPSTSS